MAKKMFYACCMLALIAAAYLGVSALEYWTPEEAPVELKMPGLGPEAAAMTAEAREAECTQLAERHRWDITANVEAVILGLVAFDPHENEGYHTIVGEWVCPLAVVYTADPGVEEAHLGFPPPVDEAIRHYADVFHHVRREVRKISEKEIAGELRCLPPKAGATAKHEIRCGLSITMIKRTR